MVFRKIKYYMELVMFSNTIFSFSFAIVALLLATKGAPSFRVVLWVTLAFLGARTGANALNRLIDKEIDAKDPRTAIRHLPSGLVSNKEVLILIIVSFAVLTLSAFMLNWICAALLPVAFLLFILYSYTKRFTFACHLFLGFVSGGAPVGAWIAATGTISFSCLVLAFANAVWVAGFDIIYSTMDMDFDRKEGLHSIPVAFGVKKALQYAVYCHIAAVAALIFIYFLEPVNWLYLVGIAVVAGILVMEHKMVSVSDLSNVKIASYNMNRIISIAFLIFSVSGILIQR